MKTVAGWLCPDLLSGPGNYLRRAADTDIAVRRCARLRTAIQAGGHIGTVPAFLAPRFVRLYTFEPDQENFLCLVTNVREQHVFAARGLLGCDRGPRGLFRSDRSTGQHRVRGKGNVPTYRIDDLELPDVDAIFLDVEGYEIHALQGAQKTIERCWPVIMAEENKRALDHGFQLGDLGKYLGDLGYRLTDTVGEDKVFVHELGEKRAAA